MCYETYESVVTNTSIKNSITSEFLKMCFLILITLIIHSLVTIDPASAIECYNCESISETNCGEEFSVEEHFKIDCEQVAPPRYLSNELEYLNATGCMKKIYKEHKIIKYVRSCYFGDVNNTNIGCRMDPTMMDFQDVQCFVCTTESFCNSAVRNQYLPAYINLLATVLFPIVFTN